MKKEDIFEAMTDIDDKMILSANQIKTAQTAVPAQKPLWRTVLPAAACLCVLAGAGAFGVRYFQNRPETSSENPAAGDASMENPAVSNTNLRYPDGDKYILNPIKVIEKVMLTEEQTPLELPELPDMSLYVSKDRVTLSEPPLNDHFYVIDATADREIASLYLCDLNGDGKRELCARIAERNGSTSVEVYDAANKRYYAMLSHSRGEYSLEDKDGELYLNFQGCGFFDGVTESDKLQLQMLSEHFYNSQLVEIPAGETAKMFTLEEYEGTLFTLEQGVVSMGGTDPAFNNFCVMEQENKRIKALYLCDLDGDVKRELYALYDDGTVTAFNPAAYDSTKYEMLRLDEGYTIEAEDGVLYAVNLGDNSRVPLKYAMFKAEPLT